MPAITDHFQILTCPLISQRRNFLGNITIQGQNTILFLISFIMVQYQTNTHKNLLKHTGTVSEDVFHGLALWVWEVKEKVFFQALTVLSTFIRSALSLNFIFSFYQAYSNLSSVT